MSKLETQILRKQLKEVLHFYKPTDYRRWFHWLAPKKPGFLIIGAKLTGKTTLLEQLGIHFKNTIPPAPPQAHKLHPEHDDLHHLLQHPYEDDQHIEQPHALNPTCHWYLADEGIFIDTPGEYLNTAIEGPKEGPWFSLLQLLKSHRRALPIHGVILVVSLPDLVLQKKHKKVTIHLMQQRLFEISKHLGHALRLYVVVTQCDRITGFREYFDGLRADETEQILGFEFTDFPNTASLAKEFAQQYTALLNKINSQLITRLHQEYNAQKRYRIHDYPLQMASTKDLLTNLIYHVVEKPFYAEAIIPQGFYLTSSTQAKNTVDCIGQALQHALNIQVPQLESLSWDYPRPYFIKQLVNRILISPQHSSTQPKNWPRYVAYAFSVCLLISSGGYMAYEISKRKSNSPKIQRVIAPTSPMLAADYKPTSITIAHYLERVLNDSNTDPTHLYGSLKSYLMLVGALRPEPEFLENWLKTNWLKSQPDMAAQQSWLHQLCINLPKHSSSLKLNTQIVTAARAKLSGLPSSVLAYVILKTGNNLNHLWLLEDKEPNDANIFSYVKSSHGIPYLYSAKGFQEVFLKNYQQTVKIALSGDAVLGSKTNNINDPQIKETTAELIALYLNDYVSWWDNNLHAIKIIDIQNLMQAQKVVSALVQPNSQLINLIQTLATNSIPPELLAQKAQQLPKTLLVQTAIEHYQQSRLHDYSQFVQIANREQQQPLLHALSEVNNYLSPMSATTEPLKIAFAFSLQRMQTQGDGDPISHLLQQAKLVPQPLQTWMQDLGMKLWTLILQDSKEYINQQWSQTVWPTYNSTLANRYPLYNTSKEDASFDDFTRFFNTKGILTQFFENNLQPFIDTSTSQWHWKSVDGLTLNLPESILQNFERGRIITRMFFPQNNEQLNLNFTLQQIAMMPIIKRFRININGQVFVDAQGAKESLDFIWPGNNNTANRSSIDFETVNEQKIAMEEIGPWAFFRLLDRAKIKPVDLKHFQITFINDGAEAQYMLNINNEINPFITGIINEFRIEERLG